MSGADFRSTSTSFRQTRLAGRPRVSWLLLGVIAMLMLPSIEIAAFIAVTARIGFAPALLAFVLTSVLGLALLRQQGGTALRRVRDAARGGRRPDSAMRDGLWFALGGVLMIVPGFVTDAIGFALMLPTLIRGWSAAAVPAPGAVRPEVRARARPAEDGIVDLAASEWRTVSEGARR